MAPRTVYANLADGLQPFSLWDQSLGDMGLLGAIPCSATGTNAIVLTPLTAAYTPNILAYSNYLLFSFVAPASSTGSVTVQLSIAGVTLAALPLYKNDGASQAGANDVLNKVLYVVGYNSALNSGVGGFQQLTTSQQTAGGGGLVQVTTASAAIAAGTPAVAINRSAPATTALTLPSAASQSGLSLSIFDWSTSVTSHTITLTPNAGDVIMRQSSWSILSNSASLGSLTLRPSTTLGGWYIAP